MTERALPVLADLVHQFTYRAKRDPQVMRLRGWMRRAHRIVIDDTMLDLMVQSSVDLSRLHTRLWLARLPFDVTWIEYDQRAHLRAQNRFSRMNPDTDLSEVPERSGYLLVRDPGRPTRCAVFGFYQTSEGGAEPSLPVFVFDTEDPVGDEIGFFELTSVQHILLGTGTGVPAAMRERVDGLSRMIPLGLNFGQASDDAFKNLVNEQPYASQICTALTAETAALIREGGLGQAERAIQMITMALREEAGIVRQLITLLAMMNTVPVITKNHSPRGYRPVGMNKVGYFSYSTVTLQLPKRNPLLYVQRALSKAGREQEKRRAHMVRTYWREMRATGRAGCEHSFRNVEGNRYACTRCGRVGHWIGSYQRGDAARGWVHQQYRIEAS